MQSAPPISRKGLRTEQKLPKRDRKPRLLTVLQTVSHRPAFHNHPAAPGNSRVHVSEEPGPCGAHKRRGLSPAWFLRSQRLQVSGKVGRTGLSQAGESRGRGLGAARGPGLAMAGVGTGSCWLTPCVLETTRCTTRGRSLPPRPSAGRSQPATRRRCWNLFAFPFPGELPRRAVFSLGRRPVTLEGAFEPLAVTRLLTATREGFARLGRGRGRELFWGGRPGGVGTVRALENQAGSRWPRHMALPEPHTHTRHTLSMSSENQARRKGVGSPLPLSSPVTGLEQSR